MGLDISSNSGLSFSSGYGTFTFMRQECCNQILKGSAAIHEWASRGSMFLWGVKRKDEGGYDLPAGISSDDFVEVCNILLAHYFMSNGWRAFWTLFICHSDCDGKLTAKQCQRLAKDLNRIEPGPLYGEKFKEFRELVREAGKRNETLFFG